VTGGDEVKLGRRSRDAGPAVIVIDRSERDRAAAAAEKEPNDTDATAQALALPGAVRGRIDGAGDRDLYAVTVPAPGTLRVVLGAVEDADLVLEVRQPGGQRLAISDNLPAKVAESVPNLFVQPGPLILEVREFVKPPPKAARGKKAKAPPPPPPPRGGRPSQPYLLEVSLLPPPAEGDEREPNEEPAFATDLPLGTTGRGMLSSKRDIDVWRVALEGAREDEALSIDVEGVEGVALKVTLLDGAGAPLVERKGRPGATVSLRSVAVPEPATVVFVAVSGDRASDGEHYTVRAASAPIVLDEEIEPNDTPATASPLADVPGTTSGTRVGTLAAGDVDCYRLEPDELPRRLSLIFAPPAGVDGQLAVVAEDGTVLAGPADAGRRGGEERLVDVPVPPGRAAIVKVTGKAGDASERYRLRWSVTDAPEPEPVLGVDE
jgi:hypothetical protein